MWIFEAGQIIIIINIIIIIIVSGSSSSRISSNIGSADGREDIYTWSTCSLIACFRNAKTNVFIDGGGGGGGVLSGSGWHPIYMRMLLNSTVSSGVTS